ncbi:MAG: AAA family ATPase, partial [Sorangiineae bacterium PRO1]|nr:AAA family ATPase [Sorangiineae bacterium PRO1]
MARAPTNLRPDPSSFVGRDADLARVKAALESASLVSLTGPPGVGKSRLAKELALTAGHPAWFCDLSVAESAEGIAARVASVLDLPLAEGRSAKDAVAQIARALSRRGAVTLLLDDFDHLVPHAEGTLGIWRSAAPRARFVVTTRQRLGLAGESVIELHPLGAEAVELFVERARAVRRSFEPTKAELALIGRLVERLDGLPLAIELAAARAGVLGVRQLLERLEGSLSALDR